LKHTQKVLNIRPGAYQYDLQKNIAKIASSVPFAEAAEIIRDTYGYKITQDTIHQMTNELAAHGRLEELAPDPASIHSVVDEVSQGKRQRPVLVFTADGAMAPVRTEKGRPNCWKENKGIRVDLVDDDHIVHIMSWHQICDKEKFIEYLQNIKNLNLFPKAITATDRSAQSRGRPGHDPQTRPGRKRAENVSCFVRGDRGTGPNAFGRCRTDRHGKRQAGPGRCYLDPGGDKGFGRFWRAIRRCGTITLFSRRDAVAQRKARVMSSSEKKLPIFSAAFYAGSPEPIVEFTWL
jgi:hypothetical protein